MSTDSGIRSRLLRRPAPVEHRPVWAAGLGADLSSLSDGAAKGDAVEQVAEPVAEPIAKPAPAAAAKPVAEPVAESLPVAVAVLDTKISPEGVAAVEDRQSLQSVLEELLVFDGSIGVALVDAQSGMILGEAGSSHDLGLSAAGASVILRARLETNRALGLGEEIADVLITLSSQIQIIHPLAKNPKLFLYLIGDKTNASLAMARYKAAEADDSIRL